MKIDVDFGSTYTKIADMDGPAPTPRLLQVL